MNNMKRFLALMLALCLMLGLCACGGNGGGTEPTDEPTDPTPAPTAGTDATDPTQAQGGYVVKVVDEAGNPIANAMVQLCLDVCLPKPTDANGIAVYDVEEADYKVSFLALPAGYDYTTAEQEFYFADGSTEMTITLKAVA